MSLPNVEQIFSPAGGPVFRWPEDGEILASASRFNAINAALYGFIKQLEGEHGTELTAQAEAIALAAQTLEQHTTALAARYTKTEADAASAALAQTIQAVQDAVDNLNALYQTDAEAAAALAALSSQWDATSTDFQATVTGWMNDRYTKAQTDALLAAKANAADVYSKTAADALMADKADKTTVNQALNTKADKTAVYTYQEVDDLLAGKAAANHNHTLKIGDGTAERMTLGTQERLNFKAGSGVTVSFNDTSKTLEIATDGGTPVAYSELKITPTAGQTVFVIDGGYTVGAVAVFKNGVRLVAVSDYAATNGTTITLVTPATTSDTLVVSRLSTFAVADTYTKAEVDAAVGLDYLTEVRSTTAPNTTVPVHGVQASGDEADIDLLLAPKRNGAIVAALPNEASSGGAKRGQSATDFQQKRTAATQVASGYASMIGGGSANTASGQRSVVAGGEGNTASGITATVSGGRYNLADGINSTVPGGNRATTNGISGLLAYGFNSGVLGESQMSFWGGRAFTATATPTRMIAEGVDANATNQLTLRNNSVFRVRGTVVARNTTTNDCKEWTFEALIKRGASAAATAIVGTPSITSTFADASTASWGIAVTADTTNGALAITATGAASTTIRWTAVVHSIEVA